MGRLTTCSQCKSIFTKNLFTFSDEDNDFCSYDCKTVFENPFSNVDLVVCDAGTLGVNGKAKAVSWAYCFVDSRNNLITSKVDMNWELKTSPQGEVLAIIEALEALPVGWSGKVWSDCLYALKVVFKTDYWDGYIWSDKKLNPKLKKRRDVLWRKYDGFKDFEIELLSGHPNKKELEAKVAKNGRRVSEWNVVCDSLCTDIMEEWKVNTSQKP